MTEDPDLTPAAPLAAEPMPAQPVEPRPPRRRTGEIDGVAVELELHDQPQEL